MEGKNVGSLEEKLLSYAKKVIPDVSMSCLKKNYKNGVKLVTFFNPRRLDEAPEIHPSYIMLIRGDRVWSHTNVYLNKTVYLVNEEVEVDCPISNQKDFLNH